MEQTISIKRLDRILYEMKDISRREFLVFTTDGELVAGTTDERDFLESVSQFAASMADTQVVQNWMYFRVELHGVTEYVMLLSRSGDTEQSYLVGQMALCHVRDFFQSMEEPENRIGGLRQIINGEIRGERIGEKCHQLRLTPGRYLIYVIQHKTDSDFILVETLKNFFVNSPADYAVEMDASRTVLIKDVTDIPGEDFRGYANIIVDNLQTEVMTKVWVGYGEPVDAFEQMNRAYINACTALKIGTVFYGEECVFNYQKLGIARLIYKLPADLCEMFLQEILGENMEIDLDDETITTIRKLFDNNLNISETARQLYIHRNTLVYRLERIEKKLGLDIRTFEDAMLFKIAMMVRVHLNELNLEK